MALVPTAEAATTVAAPGPPSFPPPETFDFVPNTHDLLLRLLPPSAQLPPGTAATGLASLEPKDVDAEASRIRIKIQKARAILGDLPDVSRTIEQQQEEMKALEAKIAQQREVLGRIRQLQAVKDAASAIR
ncbi:hypothetical protein Dda_5384 [Drechslerella dactyloides]|uniref:Mediator of RNA polymerase II transcription subunit 9 n=1 Tax=Drechslerella dactyloides TaxID=74499 RepID=A0AAD6IXF1_DREDA|nr:hypothetical protein Dda_5384 [Drechslerella dactyloides]